MIKIREQDILEIGSFASETELCFPCKQGYQKVQLEAINELLSTKDFLIIIDCDFSDPASVFVDKLNFLGEYTVIASYAFLLLFPFIFPFIRYRKDRKTALAKHYRHSKSSGVTMAFIIILPFVLFFFELWLFGSLGWIDFRLWK